MNHQNINLWPHRLLTSRLTTLSFSFNLHKPKLPGTLASFQTSSKNYTLGKEHPTLLAGSTRRNSEAFEGRRDKDGNYLRWSSRKTLLSALEQGQNFEASGERSRVKFRRSDRQASSTVREEVYFKRQKGTAQKGGRRLEMSEADFQADRPDGKINHEDAKTYWQSVDADVNGMLGGYPYVSRVDLQGSKNFLAKLGVGSGKRAGLRGAGVVADAEVLDGRIGRAADCGAGIGRITEGLLLSLARTVDIVEPIAKFSAGLQGREGVGNIYNVGLEEWTPGDGVYDLIWNQWCVGHLTDQQLVEYLRKCGAAVRAGGWIVVKENLATSINGEDLFDDVDSSVTRTEEKFKLIFQQSELVVKKTELQKGMPKELYPVRIWALQPRTA